MSDKKSKYMDISAIELSSIHDNSYHPLLESHLVDKFEAILRQSTKTEDFTIKREVGVGRNIADLVAFYLPSNNNSLFSARLSAADAVIVSLLRKAKRISISQLANSAELTDELLLRRISSFIKAGLVYVEGSSLVLRENWPSLKIVAYEAKLKNWREALEQASDYLHFADEAYVVMPETFALKAVYYLEIFLERGVGIISVDNHSFKILLESSRKNNHDWRREFVYSRAYDIRNT